MFNRIKQYILDFFEENGIHIDEHEIKNDLDLREYLVDSLQHVYFVVDLEKRLGFELPDNVLLYDNLSSMNGFINMIISIHPEEHDCFDNNDECCEDNEKNVIINMEKNSVFVTNSVCDNENIKNDK